MKLTKVLSGIGLVGMLLSFFFLDSTPTILYLFDPLMIVLLGIESIADNFEEIIKTGNLKYLLYVYVASIIIIPLIFGLSTIGIAGDYAMSFAGLYKMGVLGIVFYFMFKFKTKPANDKDQA